MQNQTQSMSSAKSQKILVGFKSTASNLHAHRNLISKLGDVFDFIEYTAPILGFDKLVKGLNCSPKKLRPHSVLVSLASNWEPPKHVLAWLKRELDLTNAPYLGDHIGLLNPGDSGPSLSYIYPPDLSTRSIQNINRNVRIMEDFCQRPLALENPIFYIQSEHQSSWQNYIEELSSVLPESTGWLIDCGHLLASCLNIKDWSMDAILKSYLATNRRIFEWHIAGVKLDRNNVWHDDHASINSSFVMNKYHSIIIATSDSTNILTLVLERDINSQADIDQLVHDADELRKLFASPITYETSTGMLPISNASAEIRKVVERKGRATILLERILSDLSTHVTREQLHDLVLDCGFNDLLDFADAFMERISSVEYISTSVPLYSWDEPDHYDLLAPCYHFLQDQLPHQEQSQSTLRQILTACAIKKAESLPYLTETKGIYLTLKESTQRLLRGNYQIAFDNGEIVAFEFNSNRYPQGAFLFFDGEPITQQT